MGAAQAMTQESVVWRQERALPLQNTFFYLILCALSLQLDIYLQSLLRPELGFDSSSQQLAQTASGSGAGS